MHSQTELLDGAAAARARACGGCCGAAAGTLALTSVFRAAAGVADRLPLCARRRSAAMLSELAHRPWPLAPGSWLMAQTWRDLLFAHWPVAPSVLEPLLPAGVEPDTFQGQAWLTVVVFEIADVHLRGWPPMPLLRGFPEINLRTYVCCHGQPGVWFFSLDCPNPLVVALARPWYLLPYRYLRTPAFRAAYRPTGSPFRPVVGSLEHWLVERYAYFTADARGQLYRCDIHHAPWRLQSASVSISRNDLIAWSEPPALSHYVRQIEAVIWPISPLPPRSASAPPPAR